MGSGRVGGDIRSMGGRRSMLSLFDGSVSIYQVCGLRRCYVCIDNLDDPGNHTCCILVHLPVYFTNYPIYTSQSV
jgi:hypothetical protein